MPAITLRTKLFGTVLLSGTMLLVGGLVGIFSLRQSSHDTEAMFQSTTRPLMHLEAMGRHLGAIRAEVLGHILESSPEAKARLDASIRDRVAKIQEASRAYAAHDMEPDERAAIQEFDAAVATYHAARESKVLPPSRAGRREEAAAAATGEVRLIYQKARDIVDRMVAATTSEGQVEAAQAMERYATLRNWMLGLTLLGIALASAAGYWVARTITTKAEKVRALTADLASGDLTARITLAAGEEADELGQIGNALNVIMGTFQESLQEVQRATQSVSQAAAEIAAGNSDLSVRTEGQAANVEETASSMEEFGSTVEATATNAAKAATAAGEAARITREGRTAVGSLVGSMEEINQSARRINDIIGVVDEIAFQTNLLALNAAVEAARAGEQGRGFAVVASEVRSLAKRSADAAKEIKGLIREAVRKAQEGRETAARTDGIIQEVAENVQRTSDVISEIASATREQNSGIGEINRAVAQMDQGTQQNAAMVEQAAAAAESLNEQALTLGAVVARFKTGATSQGSVRQGSLDVQGAIHAHSRWLMRLKGFVEGFSEQDLDAAKVGRDDLCDLGKWIHGSGRNETDPALYAELKEQHAAFHVCAGGVIHVHRSRGKAAAEQLLLPESEFMQLSARVIRLLQQGLGRARQPRAAETAHPLAAARPEAGRPAPSRKPAPALSRKPAPALRGELASSKPMVAPPADDGDWESF